MDVVGGDRVAVLVPLHAGVAVGAEAAEEAVVGDAERRHRVGELAAAVLAEAVVAVGGEVLELGDEDLAHLTGGAGHQRDPAALGDVLRHRGALADRLVVGVGVHEQEALVGSHDRQPSERHRRGRCEPRAPRAGGPHATYPACPGPGRDRPAPDRRHRVRRTSRTGGPAADPAPGTAPGRRGW